MTPNPSIKNQETTDFKKIAELVSSHYKLFVIALVVALVAAFLVNQLTIPVYKIASSLLIKEEKQPLNSNVNEFLNSKLFGTNQNLQNELWVLKSTEVMEQTVRSLGLNVDYYNKKRFRQLNAYHEAPFIVHIFYNHAQPVGVRFRISLIDTSNFEIEARGRNVSIVDFNNNELIQKQPRWKFKQYGKFGELIETSDAAFIIERDTTKSFVSADKSKYSFEITDMVSKIDQIKDRLEFGIIDKQSTVIEIKYKTPSIREGKDLVNEIMQVYSNQNLERKNHTASMTVQYIEKQLGEISDSLSNTEETLQRFRSSNQLLNASEQAANLSQQYMNLQNQLAELTTQKRYYDNIAESLTKSEDISNMVLPSSMGINNPLLNNLMSELITAYSQRSNLLQNDQELNPVVQKLTIQIENAKKTISENIAAVRKTTDISVDEMRKRIYRTEAEISRLPKTQRQLGGIERKYTLNDAIYNYLLEKRAEAKITQAANQPDDIIIDPAKLTSNKPVFPNKGLNFSVALIIGLLIPLGFLTLKDALDTKITSEEFFDQFTNVPIMGKIVHNYRKSGNVIIEYPNSSLNESYRALRTNLEYQFHNKSQKVIMVTSCIEGEGKSFNAGNLALSYLQLGQKTILLDFDLRNPATSYFGVAPESLKGISSWYLNGNNFQDILHHSPFEKLDFIPSGPVPPNPLELMANEKTRMLINHLRNMYDCIILDTTPLAQVSDAYLLMDIADIKIIVARYNYSFKKVISLTMKGLAAKNINNLCFVLNDNKIYNDQYGYGYGYKNKK
jgi:tyrosine-protein kinase Etk/Wzc